MTSAARIETDESTPAQRKAIRFQARSFLAFALTPEAPLSVWLEELDRWTQNSPGFFAGRPVVLDLSQLDDAAGEAAGLVQALATRGIRTYAIEGVALEDETARALPPLLKGAKPAAMAEPAAAPKAAADDTGEAATADVPADLPAPALGGGTLTVDQPVRSGQSIHHPGGDVIVLGSVASGSEIVAGGSVHVYGTLRGRVFAGADGNPQARIFCRRNEAELLAIDGWYRTPEEMDSHTQGKAIQVFLDEGAIRVEALG